MSPFLGDDDMETISNVALGEFEYPNSDPNEGYEDISVDAKAFIDSLLTSRPSQRSTADSSLQHKWLINQRQIKRIGTGRLKRFRARRRMLATIQAVRVSLAMMKGAIRKKSI